MKHFSIEYLIAGVWGLHFTSYIMASIPYLQLTSLLLAITVSILTMSKLRRDTDKLDEK